ncbi:hypothetical protein [Salinibaculum rarum]|uniref:hypothetical protein n=1 Tax=Salinibaculum rarum TaxID=3058903 RepID=UPI00265D712E|nr:hypothetical protein [Salinibaculum sp. KK48]
MTSEDHQTELEYTPLEDHFCDGYIVYDDTTELSVPIDAAGRTQLVTRSGECEICGRSLRVTFEVSATMQTVTDAGTDTVLHTY